MNHVKKEVPETPSFLALLFPPCFASVRYKNEVLSKVKNFGNELLNKIHNIKCNATIKYMTLFLKFVHRLKKYKLICFKANLIHSIYFLFGRIMLLTWKVVPRLEI